MITRRIVLNVITFGVISAIVVTALVVTVFRVQPRYTVVVELPHTGGAFTGQEVTYRGVTVGRIGDLRVSERGVHMDLVIESRFDEIPRDTDARVMFKSPVGEQFVDLLPRTQEPPFLADGDEIPIERTVVPPQQEDLLRLLNDVLEGIPPETLASLIDTLGEGLSGRGDELHRALAALDPITEVLARRTSEINRILVSGDRAGAAFGRTSDEFVGGVRSLARVADVLARNTGELERILEAGSETIPELAGLVSARKQELDRTISNLAELTGLTFDNLASVDDTLEWLPLFLETQVRVYDPEMNRFRFGTATASGNEPCSYGTPRRGPDAEGNASHHPVIDFECITGGES